MAGFDYNDLTAEEALDMMRQEEWVSVWNRSVRGPSAVDLPTKLRPAGLPTKPRPGGVGAGR